jgi:D-glucosaminate-6-phosphate ammonia-lyase
VLQPTVLSSSIFHQLGVRPVINACGIYTDLGGSVLSPRVWAAMEESNRSYVSMVELLESSGHSLADLMGAHAARVTTGASAAIALGTAACMTGVDGLKWEQLPDTTGMKNEVVMQRHHRYKYDRCARMTGARVIEAGDDRGTTLEQLAATLGPRTAAVLFPAHLDGKPGTVPLLEVSALCHRQGIPLVVDAAYLNYPTDFMKSFVAAGADLVCFSAKYFFGPNSGGFICGRKDLIDAVAGLDFTRYESGAYRSFGRPFKLDRQIVVGVVVALQEWMSMDHEARWAGYAEKVRNMAHCLENAPGIDAVPRYFTMDERLVSGSINCLAVSFAPEGRFHPDAVSDALRQGDPSIATPVLGDTLVLAVDTLLENEEWTVAERLREILRA